ncbi:MAG: hypothetical protein UHM08_09175 [Bacteroidales bacterium]|jgi:hypothetical protein|nr:hypothetical protein [Bacteroidales bacterium]
MFSLLTDKNNDLYLNITDNTGLAISNSVLATDDSSDALRQVIVNRVRLQQGEYKYDLSRGIDYMGLLLTDTPLVRIWENQVLSLVSNIPEITGIRYWNYGLEDNNFIFRLTVDSEYGTIEIKG